MAPVEFFVSNDGHLATLDNWHNLGYGKVVSVYDSRGELVRSYELSDLFQADELKEFSQSVPSIHWRTGPAYIRHDQKTLLVTVKSGGDFLFGLETGRYKYCEYHENACIGAEPAINQGNGCQTIKWSYPAECTSRWF